MLKLDFSFVLSIVLLTFFLVLLYYNYRELKKHGKEIAKEIAKDQKFFSERFKGMGNTSEIKPVQESEEMRELIILDEEHTNQVIKKMEADRSNSLN